MAATADYDDGTTAPAATVPEGPGRVVRVTRDGKTAGFYSLDTAEVFMPVRFGPDCTPHLSAILANGRAWPGGWIWRGRNFFAAAWLVSTFPDQAEQLKAFATWVREVVAWSNKHNQAQ